MSKATEQDVTRHLEYFGYVVQEQPDGWWYAEHPVRLNMHVRAFELGVRLVCVLWVGPHVADRKPWLEFVNRANGSAILARFAFERNEEGDYYVRARALLPPTYRRRLFGLLLDAWHEDLLAFRSAPREAPVEEDDEQEAEKPAAVVN